MAEFKITFTHLVEIKYETIIEANDEQEAKDIFDEDPFGRDVEELGEQGLDIKNIKVKVSA